jgi:hypothetical protein
VRRIRGFFRRRRRYLGIGAATIAIAGIAIGVVIGTKSDTVPPGTRLKWRKLKPPAGGPSARCETGAAFDSQRNRIVNFGGIIGCVSPFAANAETWTYDGRKWTQLSPAASPGARSRTGAVYDSGRDRIVLFGGMGSDPYPFYDETWEFDGSTWAQRSPATVPDPRAYPMLAYDPVRTVTVMFGGRGSPSDFSETWEWNGTDWSQASPSTVPSARILGYIGYDPNSSGVIMFGGWKDNDFLELDKTWLWNGTNWVDQSPAFTPLGAMQVKGAYHAASKVTVVHSGFTNGFTLPSLTYAWDGSDWRVAVPKAGPIDYMFGDCVYMGSRKTIVCFHGNICPSFSCTPTDHVWDIRWIKF